MGAAGGFYTAVPFYPRRVSERPYPGAGNQAGGDDGGLPYTGESVHSPGAVVTSRGTDDYTQYTAVLNTADGSYAVRTYEDGRIRTARLTEQALSGSKAACLFALER